MSEVIDGYRDAFASFVEGRDEPGWVGARRQAAFERLVETGLPTRRLEEWKYTPVGRFGRDVFRPLPAGELDVDALVDAARLGDEAALLVFVGGRFDAGRSTVGDLGRSIRVRRLVDGWDEGVADLLAPADTLSGFDALRAAFVEDGALIEFAPEIELDRPIHVLHVAPSAATPYLAATSNVIRLGGHCKATVVESFTGAPGADHLTCTATRVSLGDGATLAHYRVQNASLESAHVAHDQVVVSRDGTYRSFNFSIGGAVARDDLEVRVEGPGAHTEACALYVPGDGQTIDNHTTIDHRAPNCTADQLYKGILDGTGHGVFNGRVFVRQAAQQTSAEQLNQNLMLSREARIDTKPQLEIFADDVRCTHGATVGQIEPEELFYMMSRAIPEDVARRIIVRGFADGVLERVQHAGTAERMGALVDARLGA